MINDQSLVNDGISECRKKVSPASAFRNQGQSATAGHGLVRNCPALCKRLPYLLDVKLKLYMFSVQPIILHKTKFVCIDVLLVNIVLCLVARIKINVSMIKTKKSKNSTKKKKNWKTIIESISVTLSRNCKTGKTEK